MTDKMKYPLFASVLWRLIEGFKLREPSMSAGPLGYRNAKMVDMWMWGTALPSLTKLPSFAKIGIPHEHMLLPWLADSDPANLEAYRQLAIKLMGDEAKVDDLLSGAREVSTSPWWD